MKIIGNIGRDIEDKTTKGGRAFKSFTVAESYGKDDNRTTNWFGISFYGKPEELAGFSKGTRVEVEGDLKVTVKDGKAYLDMLTSRVKAAPLPAKKETTGATETAGAAPATGGVKDQFSDMDDDDIPF
jgi:single-stranded DNA-binding protein